MRRGGELPVLNMLMIVMCSSPVLLWLGAFCCDSDRSPSIPAVLYRLSDSGLEKGASC